MKVTRNISKRLGEKIPGANENGVTLYNCQSEHSPLVGECIYCGSTIGLTDEHTIPFSLYGIAKLKRASCSVCSLETQKVEQRVLRDTFGMIRQYLNFPTRKARKNGSWDGKANITKSHGEHTRKVPIEESLVALCLPFPGYQPRIISGEPYGKKHEVRKLFQIAINSSTASKNKGYWADWIKFNPTDVERCFAKIAYCETIRTKNIQLRDRRLSGFILGHYHESSSYLGSVEGEPISDNIHEVKLFHLTDSHGEISDKQSMTSVRLFSFLPTPTYQIVLSNDKV